MRMYVGRDGELYLRESDGTMGSLVLEGRGAAQQLRAIGVYSDGIERELTDESVGTDYYTPGPQVVHVTLDGTVLALTPGENSIYARNSGINSNSVSVQVLDGPDKNSPPHADAGGPYIACDSQIVYLDGSDTSDLDEVLGDDLTYEWDLDADGEFDDAFGEAPLVSIIVKGEAGFVGLRVTDSSDLTSIDYALVEAGAECLLGKHGCAIEPGAAIEDIGSDSSDQLYVLEQVGTGQISVFASDCQLVRTFSVASHAGGMAVGQD